MNKLSTISLVLISLLLSSCAKKGCTDAEALNFEAGSKKDDGSCLYPSSVYLGKYAATETIDNDVFFGITRSYISYEFEIQKNIEGKIQFIGFFKCSDDLIAEPDSLSFTILGYMFCDKSLNAHFALHNDTLTYDCRHTSSSANIHRWGIAIKN
jgi:hypothetical protein